jgi:hypothetical protein
MPYDKATASDATNPEPVAAAGCQRVDEIKSRLGQLNALGASTNI